LHAPVADPERTVFNRPHLLVERPAASERAVSAVQCAGDAPTLIVAFTLAGGQRWGLNDNRSNQRRPAMVTKALFVRLEAKPGKEADVESFLRGGLSIVEQEPATTAWFAVRIGPPTFGIFDVFPDEAGRQAHLSGAVAKALKEQAAELFSERPSIGEMDVFAAKLPR
jgi:quinol monooxygenase YgiN